MKNPPIKKRTRQGEHTYREILRVAVDLASSQGLEGLTIGMLAQSLSMSKSGLFDHFGSKEDLQLAVIDFAREIFMERIVQPALAASPGIARLKALLAAWVDYIEAQTFSGGCFFAAASAEFDGRPGVVRDQLANLMKAWLAALTAEVAVAQSLQQLDAQLIPEQLAFELHAYVQEANWAFQLFGQKNAFELARKAIDSKLKREK